MSFHLFGTPALALMRVVQIAVKVGIHKQSGISMFLVNYSHPSTMFLGPKVEALVQGRREGLQREESISQSLFWEDYRCRFPSS